MLRPFEQVESSYARKHGGSGLGLPYADRLTFQVTPQMAGFRLNRSRQGRLMLATSYFHLRLKIAPSICVTCVPRDTSRALWRAKNTKTMRRG